MPKDFIHEIELSVRAGNVCRAAGWTTYHQFMAITKDDWMEQKHAGIRTWREIKEVQDSLRALQRGKDLLERAVDHVREAQHLLQHLDPEGLRLRMEIEHGQPVIYKRLT